jgi:hypothetical protein
MKSMKKLIQIMILVMTLTVQMVNSQSTALISAMTKSNAFKGSFYPSNGNGKIVKTSVDSVLLLDIYSKLNLNTNALENVPNPPIFFDGTYLAMTNNGTLDVYNSVTKTTFTGIKCGAGDVIGANRVIGIFNNKLISNKNTYPGPYGKYTTAYIYSTDLFTGKMDSIRWKYDNVQFVPPNYNGTINYFDVDETAKLIYMYSRPNMNTLGYTYLYVVDINTFTKIDSMKLGHNDTRIERVHIRNKYVALTDENQVLPISWSEFRNYKDSVIKSTTGKFTGIVKNTGAGVSNPRELYGNTYTGKCMLPATSSGYDIIYESPNKSIISAIFGNYIKDSIVMFTIPGAGSTTIQDTFNIPAGTTRKLSPTANGFTSYYWSTGDSSKCLEIAYSDIPSFKYNRPTQLEFIAFDTIGKRISSNKVTLYPTNIYGASIVITTDPGLDKKYIVSGKTITKYASKYINVPITASAINSAIDTSVISYNWNDGSFPRSRNISTPNKYKISMSYYGFIASDSVTIVNIPNELAVIPDATVCDSSVTNVSCVNTGTYNLSWNVTGNSMTNGYSSPTNGSAKIVIKASDWPGCSSVTVNVISRRSDGLIFDRTYNVNFKSALSASINTDSVSLCKSEIATINATMPVNAYHVSWSDGVSSDVTTTTSRTFTGTGSGSEYELFLTITSANLCGSYVKKISVLNKSAVSVSISGTTSICSGSNTIFTASGAAAYAWNTGSTLASITASAAGKYKVTGTTNGCSNSDSVTLTVKAMPTTKITGITSICNGDSTTFTASGATTYVWNTGSTLASITTKAAQLYIVTGTTNGCSKNDSITLVSKALPYTYITGTTSICSGYNTTFNVSGATTYLWSTGATSTSISVGTAGKYKVTGTTNGCSKSDSVTLTVKTLPVIKLTADATTICSTSSTTITASGATAYNWSTGATSTSISVSSAGKYKVTGTANGCLSSDSVTIVTVVPATINITNSDASICKGTSVSLIATAANNTGSISWSNGSNDNSINVTPLTTTKYYASASNAYCATVKDSVTITVNAIPSVTILVAKTSICANDTMKASATGASTYKWSDGTIGLSMTAVLSNTTTFDVIGTDAKGCVDTAYVTMHVNARPIVSISASKSKVCLGSSTVLTASGAAAYVWSTGATSSSLTVSPTSVSSYSVIGTTNGCKDTASTSIGINSIPVVTLNASKSIACADNIVTLTASGAKTYTWFNASSTTNVANVTSNKANSVIYGVTGTDANGCVSTEVTLPVKFTEDVTISVSDTVILDHIIDSTNYSSVIKTTGIGVVTWTIQNKVIDTISNKKEYTYVFTITSEGGCSETATCVVIVSSNITNAVNTNKVSEISVYPNPVTDVINVRTSGEGMVMVTDMTGKNVSMSRISENAAINASNFAPGIYMISVISNGSKVTKKIIKN